MDGKWKNYIYIYKYSVHLCANEDVRYMRHTRLEFRNPLLLDVVVRGWVHHRKADEENISVGVGEWPELIVVLLKKGIRQKHNL